MRSTELTEAWHRQALGWFKVPALSGGPLHLPGPGFWRPGCWLHQHDPKGEACSGHLEGIHFLTRKRLRFPWGFDPELRTLAEWDGRNGGAACTRHHRRFDNQATPKLVLPVAALPLQVLAFIRDWGQEQYAEERFTGDLCARLSSTLQPGP